MWSSVSVWVGVFVLGVRALLLREILVGPDLQLAIWLTNAPAYAIFILYGIGHSGATTAASVFSSVIDSVRGPILVLSAAVIAVLLTFFYAYVPRRLFHGLAHDSGGNTLHEYLLPIWFPLFLVTCAWIIPSLLNSIFVAAGLPTTIPSLIACLLVLWLVFSMYEACRQSYDAFVSLSRHGLDQEGNLLR